MPIIRHGYRSDEDKRVLAQLYASAAWKQARKVVLARSGGCCEFCREPPLRGQPLDVAHLGVTLDIIRSGADPCDVTRLRAAHRRCHRRYSAGMLEEVR